MRCSRTPRIRFLRASAPRHRCPGFEHRVEVSKRVLRSSRRPRRSCHGALAPSRSGVSSQCASSSLRFCADPARASASSGRADANRAAARRALRAEPTSAGCCRTGASGANAAIGPRPRLPIGSAMPAAARWANSSRGTGACASPGSGCRPGRRACAPCARGSGCAAVRRRRGPPDTGMNRMRARGCRWPGKRRVTTRRAAVEVAAGPRARMRRWITPSPSSSPGDDATLAAWRALCQTSSRSGWCSARITGSCKPGRDCATRVSRVVLANRVPEDGIVVFYAGDKRAVDAVAARTARAAGGGAQRPASGGIRGRGDRAERGLGRRRADPAPAALAATWLLPRDPARGDTAHGAVPGTPRNLDPGFRSRGGTSSSRAAGWCSAPCRKRRCAGMERLPRGGRAARDPARGNGLHAQQTGVEALQRLVLPGCRRSSARRRAIANCGATRWISSRRRRRPGRCRHCSGCRTSPACTRRWWPTVSSAAANARSRRCSPSGGGCSRRWPCARPDGIAPGPRQPSLARIRRAPAPVGHAVAEFPRDHPGRGRGWFRRCRAGAACSACRSTGIAAGSRARCVRPLRSARAADARFAWRCPLARLGSTRMANDGAGRCPVRVRTHANSTFAPAARGQPREQGHGEGGVPKNGANAFRRPCLAGPGGCRPRRLRRVRSNWRTPVALGAHLGDARGVVVGAHLPLQEGPPSAIPAARTGIGVSIASHWFSSSSCRNAARCDRRDPRRWRHRTALRLRRRGMSARFCACGRVQKRSVSSAWRAVERRMRVRNASRSDGSSSGNAISTLQATRPGFRARRCGSTAMRMPAASHACQRTGSARPGARGMRLQGGGEAGHPRHCRSGFAATRAPSDRDYHRSPYNRRMAARL